MPATGYTGSLIVKYLAQHPEKSKFSLGIAARSKSKLANLKQKLSLPSSVEEFYVDVTKQNEVNQVVQAAKVIINAVGPYWTWGTPVLACVQQAFGGDEVVLT